MSPHQSSIHKQPRRSILDEEIERIEQASMDEEAVETEYCIKGYDWMVSVISSNAKLIHSCLANDHSNFLFCIVPHDLQPVHIAVQPCRLNVHEHLAVPEEQHDGEARHEAAQKGRHAQARPNGVHRCHERDRHSQNA